MARDEVRGPQRPRPGSAGLPQKLIARCMPVGVVELLEAIEVKDRDGKPLAAALGSRQRPLQFVVPCSAVGKAGELVGPRDFVHASKQVGPLAQHRQMLADLGPDRGQRIEQLLVALPYRAGQKLDHAEPIVIAYQREADRRVQPRLGCHRGAGEVVVIEHVGDHRGPARVPNAPRQTHSRFKCDVLTGGRKPFQVYPAGNPCIGADKAAGVLVHSPERPVLPVASLAKLPQQPGDHLCF
jgi:hypothetical protein